MSNKQKSKGMVMKNKFIRPLLFMPVILFILFFVNGCMTSKVVDVWKESEYKNGPIDNFLVIGINGEKTQRRLWERSFVASLKAEGIHSEASYKYYPDEVPDEKDIPDLFAKEKFDGIILIEKVSDRLQKYYIPGTAYYGGFGGGRHFRGWYGGAYLGMVTPGYIGHERVLQIETSVWEPSEDGTMIWSATTSSVDPSSAKQLSKDISNLIIPRMIKDRIISSDRKGDE
jgi:hypothetical protein